MGAWRRLSSDEGNASGEAFRASISPPHSHSSCPASGVGGAFADSARLWALRYALGLLRLRDEAAWQRTRAKMEGALLRVFHQINGEALPAAGPIPGVPGLTLSPGDYAALAGYLTSR